MLALQKIENAMTGIKDKVILGHMEQILNAVHDIENSGLKVAYHAANIKPMLEGNTDGLPTKYEDFCKQRFGVEKAQAYNILHVGQHVACIYDDSGNGKTYIDTYTLATILPKFEDEEGMIKDWKAYYKAVRKARTLGTTQILTIHRLKTRKKNPLNIQDEDIIELLDKGVIHAGMTIKEFTKAIEGKFNAIETTAQEADTEDTGSAAEGTGSAAEGTGKTAEGTGKTAEEKTYNIPESVVNDIYPELCRVSAECPKLAVFVDMLNQMGFKEKTAK